MAIPTNIKTLLSGEVVEWARIEFKETWDPAASFIVEGGDISNSEMKGETSFETSLKQVLKQEDYKKLEPIIRWLAKNETINIQKVMELTNKSRTTAWRYMQILVECGLVETMGNTNNVSYTKRIYKK